MSSALTKAMPHSRIYLFELAFVQPKIYIMSGQGPFSLRRDLIEKGC